MWLHVRIYIYIYIKMVARGFVESAISLISVDGIVEGKATE